MKRSKILCLLLALVLSLSCLSGCGASMEEAAPEIETPGAAHPEPGGDRPADPLVSKYAYTASYIDIPVDTSYIGSSCVSGSRLYFIANVSAGTGNYTDEITGASYDYAVSQDVLFCLDLETKECAQLGGLPPHAVPEGWEGDSYVQGIAAGADDTVWLCEQTYTYRYNLPEDFDADGDSQYNYYESGENATRVVQMGADGSILKEFSFSEAQEALQDNGLTSFLLDEAGNLYLSTWDTVLVWDQNGTFLLELPLGDMGGEVCKYSASQIGAIRFLGEMEFRPIDLSKKDWGEAIALPDNAYRIFPGIGEYAVCYETDGKIFGYNAETDKSEKLLDWIECDIDSNDLTSGDYQLLPDGRVVAVLQDWDGFSKPQVAVLTRVEAESLPEKTILTLACFGMDFQLRSAIVDFNRTNQSYRIEVADYSEYAEEGNFYAGLTRLNTEILSGQVPDLLLTAGIPVDKYAARGLLEDLWKYIDADANIRREDLMTEVLDTVSLDGKLYAVPTGFYVTALGGLQSVVGEYEGNWNLETMELAMEKLLPEATVFNRDYTRQNVLVSYVARGIDQFIDWQTGTCYFDSPEFIQLLKFTDRFPLHIDDSDYDWETDYESDYQRMRRGAQLLSTVYFSSFDDLSVYSAALNGEPCYIGSPAGGGNTVSSQMSLAIFSAGQSKDAAWGFVRSLLQERYQDQLMGFPINRRSFEKRALEAMTPEYQRDENGQFVLDENGEKIEQSKGGVGWGSDEMYEIYAVTQEEYDTFLRLLESATWSDFYDDAVMTILIEEAGPYFNGEKTAEDTAKAIQSRVKLYVAEQS